jgi:hypothetical protein
MNNIMMKCAYAKRTSLSAEPGHQTYMCFAPLVMMCLAKTHTLVYAGIETEMPLTTNIYIHVLNLWLSLQNLFMYTCINCMSLP